MRINQSPHWRALAVLGALLSVIIVWPTVLSMPMLTTRTTPTTPSTTTTNTTAIEDQQHPSYNITSFSNLTSNISTVAAPNLNLIQINREQTTNFSEYSDYRSYLLQLNVNTSDSEDHDQYDDRDIDVDEHLTHDRGDIDILYAAMTDGDVSNSRRVKKSNMVYNKRKRKKKNNSNNNSNNNDQVSAEEDVSNTTYLSSASISDYDSSTVSSLSSNININSSSVSVSDVKNSDKVRAASIISHHYQSKRTRNSNKIDYDDSDVVSTTTSNYLSTTTTITSTPSTDVFDVRSEFWNLEQQTTPSGRITTTTIATTTTTDDDKNDTYVTSTASSIAIEFKTKTLTQTELPVLSRTDRSVHTKRGISLRQRGNTSRSNGGRAVDTEGGGGSIKPRRLNNHNRIHNYRNNNHTNSNSSNLDRNERSTISHISGPGRKIQLYIKNRFIQLMTDGTVNGTQDDLSDYTILQRTTVDVGRIKIQGVATCLYLCMDQCGAVYGSKEFTDDCVFNESMEQHNYNTYSSTYNSNSRRIYYLALNRHGEPRKLQIPPSRSLGKLATYTKAITETVPQERVETLIAKKFGANRVKHGIRQLCDTGKPLVELTDNILKARPQCTATNSNNNSNSNSNSNSNKNGQLNVPAANDKSSNSSLTNSSSNSSNSSSGHTSSNSNNNHVIKKKKKKRRCRPGENEDEHNCQRGGPQAMKKRPNNNNNNNRVAKCKEAAPDAAAAAACVNLKRPKKGGKNKQQNGGGGGGGGPKHKQNGPDGRRGGKKLNQNGRQQQGGNNSNKKNNGKQPKNGLGGGGRTTTTTTVHPIINNKMVRTPRSHSPPTTLKPTLTTTTTTTTAKTTTTAAPTMATLLQIANNQQSLAISSQIKQSPLNQTSIEAQDADDSLAEDITAEDEIGTGEAEGEEDEQAADDEDTSSHLPFIGEHTQLVGAADDFLYDDDLDFLNIGLWEIFLLIWITKWFL